MVFSVQLVAAILVLTRLRLKPEGHLRALVLSLWDRYHWWDTVFLKNSTV